jgi:MIP family channel proteins
MTHRLWQRILAEGIGTFFIVFGACGSVIADSVSAGAVTLAGIAFVPGLVVFAMITALGSISAAHFNPAVTLAFAIAKRFPWRRVPAYVAAQAAGALIAAGALGALFGPDAALRVSYGAHIPNTTPGAAFGFEVIYGFLLMLVIMAVATDARAPAGIAAPAIGLTVAAAIYLGGPISGASMNPIRSLAPALFAGGAALQALPIYLLAPIVGAALAALTYEAMRDDRRHARSAPHEW